MRCAMRSIPEPAATMAEPLLKVRDLAVRIPRRAGEVRAVGGISFGLAAGQTLGIVGESGSGKSQTALALLGLQAPGACLSGSVRFEGRELLGLAERDWNRLRGDRIGMVFQDPMTSLNPHLRVGTQLAEVLVLHRGLSRGAAAPVSARALRRHAPARDDRHGPAVPAGAADRRRAHHRPGRDGAGRDPRLAGRAARSLWPGPAADLPRPRRGGAGVRTRAGAVRRPGRRVGAGGAAAGRAAPPLQRRAAGGAAAAGHAGGPAAAGDSRPAAGPRAPAAGLRLRPALPGGGSGLRRAARAARPGWVGTPVFLPFPAGGLSFTRQVIAALRLLLPKYRVSCAPGRGHALPYGRLAAFCRAGRG